jgi:hypothetical protein
VQLTFSEGTDPSLVDGVNVHSTLSTSVPGGCWTMIVADVNARSTMPSVQWGLGQSGASAIGVVGSTVVTEKSTLPFLISDAGIATASVTVSGGGFCPGG